jgi:hypothetical protein
MGLGQLFHNPAIEGDRLELDESAILFLDVFITAPFVDACERSCPHRLTAQCTYASSPAPSKAVWISDSSTLALRIDVLITFAPENLPQILTLPHLGASKTHAPVWLSSAIYSLSAKNVMASSRLRSMRSSRSCLQSLTALPSLTTGNRRCQIHMLIVFSLTFKN